MERNVADSLPIKQEDGTVLPASSEPVKRHEPVFAPIPLDDLRFRRYMELTNEQHKLNHRLGELRAELSSLKSELLPTLQSSGYDGVTYSPTNEDELKMFGTGSTIRVSVEQRANPLTAVSLLDLCQRYFASLISTESASLYGQHLAKFIWNNRSRKTVTTVERAYPKETNDSKGQQFHASKRRYEPGAPLPPTDNVNVLAKRFLQAAQPEEELEQMEQHGEEVVATLTDAVLRDIDTTTTGNVYRK